MSNGIDEHGDISPPSIRGLSRPEAPAASSTYPMPPHVRCRCDESAQRRWAVAGESVCYACFIANANPPTGRPSISVGVERQECGECGVYSPDGEYLCWECQASLYDETPEEEAAGQSDEERRVEELYPWNDPEVAAFERSAESAMEAMAAECRSNDETPEEEATGRALDRQRQIDAERRLADLNNEVAHIINETDRIMALSDRSRAEPAVVSDSATTDLDDSPSDELTVGMW